MKRQFTKNFTKEHLHFITRPDDGPKFNLNK